MPATAGKVRMPHNNRMSTSNALRTSNMWSRTIGHDPYAAANEASNAEEERATAQQAQDLLELARHQNIANAGEDAGTRGGNDFASKMFHGLKRKKKKVRCDLESEADASGRPTGFGDLAESSSEEEYIEQEIEVEDDEKKRKHKKRKKEKKRRRESSRSPHEKSVRRKRYDDKDRHRRTRSRSSSNDSSVSSEVSRRHQRKQKKKSKKVKRYR